MSKVFIVKIDTDDENLSCKQIDMNEFRGVISQLDILIRVIQKFFGDVLNIPLPDWRLKPLPESEAKAEPDPASAATPEKVTKKWIENRRDWTKEEIAELKRLYPSTENKEIAKLLNRPVGGISWKANAIGLSKPGKNAKTQAADLGEYVRDKQPAEATEIATGTKTVFSLPNGASVTRHTMRGN
ncbi:MAG: hypothetical protein LBL72_08535 [Candidatus Accumulibacter sp.]|jgi:hypothetical protein|nr:hypothetical protein [Accumulibacter sp.]